MKAELLPLNGDPPIPLTRDITVVGRREFCDLRIDHPSLSKRHCLLVMSDGLLIVRDLISTNGTKVNGQKVAWAVLMTDSRLTLGRMKYKVYVGPDNMAAPSERPASSRRPLAPTLDEDFDDDDEFVPVDDEPSPETVRPPASNWVGDADGLEILDDDPAPPSDEFFIELD